MPKMPPKVRHLIAIYCLSATLASAESDPVDLPTLVSYPEVSSELITTSFQDNDFIERDIHNISDVTKAVPNMHISELGMGSYGNIFNIRGLTNTRLFSDPSMVFYVDDVPYSSTLAYLGSFFDIAQADVYRSPQGGLFGKNSYGGAFNLKSLAPDNQFKASLALEIENFNHYLVSSKVSGALIEDQLYFNIAGMYKSRDGYLHNDYLNITPDDQEQFGGTASLIWTPNQRWNIRLTGGMEDFDNGANRFVRLDSEDDFTVNSGDSEQLQSRSNNQSLRIAYQWDEIEFLSITSRRYWQMDPSITDLDLTPLPLLTRHISINEETWTQEFRAHSTSTQSDWGWQLGLFYSNRQRNSLFDTGVFGRHMVADIQAQETNSYAVFGHLSYQGFDDFTLTADLRYDYSGYSSEAQGNLNYPIGEPLSTDVSNHTSFVSPTFSVDYHYSDNLMLYASMGLAFKPGGIAGTSITNLEFKKETLWHNQLGLKSNFFNQRIQADLALFFYDIDDYQIERFFTPTDYSVTNAPKVYSYGVELETLTTLVDNLQLEANLGYSRTYFNDYHDPITGTDYAGNAVPYVPDFTALAALQYNHPLGYFARTEWQWVGNTYFDDANTDLMYEKGYSLLNLRVGYQQRYYSVYVYANNVTDNDYYTFKQQGVARGTPGDPRTFGVRLELSY
ncbi:MAG: TonB-dependent receptor [Methyloprofundus sp.]|nr:TonB-dependent receptor [Methyloprofundus sp.]